MTRTIERTDIPTLVEEKGYLIDPTTGEIMGMVENEFHIVDMESAEWVLARFQEAESNIAALELRKQALVENMNRMIREEQNKIDFLHHRFDIELRQFAEQELEGQSKRNIKTPYGTIQFRTVKSSYQLRDCWPQETLLNWARTEYPQAIATKECFLPSKVPDDIKAEHSLLFEYVEEEDRMYIKTGVGA